MVYESVISVLGLSRNIANVEAPEKLNGTTFIPHAYPSLLSITKFTEFVEHVKVLSVRVCKSFMEFYGQIVEIAV
jgi:hypothetical protein